MQIDIVCVLQSIIQDPGPKTQAPRARAQDPRPKTQDKKQNIRKQRKQRQHTTATDKEANPQQRLQQG